MRPKIIVNKHTPYAEQLFQTIGDVTALASSEISNESIRNADVLVVRSETKVTKELLEGSRVRFVGTVTIGTDHIDHQYLKERSITSASAAGSNANSVAEYILAALLVLSHKKNISLSDLTLGVVGIGNIGSKVVRIAEALGMKVLQCDPPLVRALKDDISSRDVIFTKQFVSFEEVLKADIITFHVPLTKTGEDATYHMVNQQSLMKMKPGAVLINTSRGSVVETDALLKALKKRHLSEAILDVWEKEPDINTELLKNVFLGTPHIAGYSLDGKLNAVQMIYEAVCRHFSIFSKINVRNFLPASELHSIQLNGKPKNKEAKLSSIIKQAYDIEVDDKSLRKIVELPENERPKYFSQLRSGYRERKEFSHYQVGLSQLDEDLKKFLQLTQFNII